MLLIVGTISLPPKNLALAEPAMRAMIEASRAELGCLAYSYAIDVVQPGLVHVLERWADQAALDQHFASPHIRVWREAWHQLGITDRNLVLYEVDRARPT